MALLLPPAVSAAPTKVAPLLFENVPNCVALSDLFILMPSYQLLEPCLISNLAEGDISPIPTLPSESIVNAVVSMLDEFETLKLSYWPIVLLSI